MNGMAIGIELSEVDKLSFRTKTGNIDIGEQLGKGNEGKVYRAKNKDQIAIKLFFKGKRSSKEGKIKAMTDGHGEDLGSNVYDNNIIWPKEVVYDEMSGQFYGYTMPKLTTPNANNALKHAMYEFQWDESTEEERLQTALNLASAVSSIHDVGHAIGDFNHDNILISETSVTLIDCDGFHIQGEESVYPGNTHFPRYSPPEKRNKKMGIDKVIDVDRFCLAVHIFQLLMEGTHPFQAEGEKAADGSPSKKINENPFPYECNVDGVSPVSRGPDFEDLPNRIQNLFEESFTTGSKQFGYERTEVSDWVDVLEDIVDDDKGKPEVNYCHKCGAEIFQSSEVEYCHKCGIELLHT